jgi:hypothetical protein
MHNYVVKTRIHSFKKTETMNLVKKCELYVKKNYTIENFS